LSDGLSATNGFELWLFGSRARGTAKPNSDIDLAVMFTSHPNWLPIYRVFAEQWQTEIAALINTRVNLQPFPKLPDEARREALLLWSRDPPAS
jgi:predicted nucleotidyltransferase